MTNEGENPRDRYLCKTLHEEGFRLRRDRHKEKTGAKRHSIAGVEFSNVCMASKLLALAKAECFSVRYLVAKEPLVIEGVNYYKITYRQPHPRAGESCREEIRACSDRLCSGKSCRVQFPGRDMVAGDAPYRPAGEPAAAATIYSAAPTHSSFQSAGFIWTESGCAFLTTRQVFAAGGSSGAKTPG